MKIEWVLFVAALAGGLFPFLRWSGLKRQLVWTLLTGLSALALLGAAYCAVRAQKKAQSEKQFLKHVPSEKSRGGYISSDNCRSCHPDQYQTWHQSYHRTMTQYASADTVVADFDNVTLEARGEKYVLQRRGKELWVEMPDLDWKAEQSRLHRITDWSRITNAPRVQRQISLVTGSHHLQKFWVASARGNLQYDLPFTWLIEDRRWVLREDSIVRDPQLPLLVQVWNMNCIKCHTTAPWPQRHPRTGAFDTTVAEMGIACESCHGPAEEHVRLHQDPLNRYRTWLAGEPDPTIVNPERQSHQASSQICGQCHSIKLTLDRDWEQTGSSYRPGGDLHQSMAVVLPARPSSVPGLDEALKDSESLRSFFWPDGMTKITGREYNGLLESPCYERGTLSCLSCHSLHGGDRNQHLTERMRSNEACLQCHTELRGALEQHTRHKAGSPGSECYNCHMPHTSWGLLKAVRSHKITSPSVQTSLDTGRPNACNLCHLDQTLSWTAKHLQDWYGIAPPVLPADDPSVSAAIRWLLKGDAGQRALIVWSMSWEPARQASGQSWMVPFLIHALDDPYAAVRHRAGRALKLYPELGEIHFDYVAPAPERAKARERVGELWNNSTATSPDRAGAHLLINADGALDRQAFDRLLQERDNRSVFLVE